MIPFPSSNNLTLSFREQEREEGQHDQTTAKTPVPENTATENTQAREGEKKAEELVRSAPSSTSISKEQPHDENAAARVSRNIGINVHLL